MNADQRREAIECAHNLLSDLQATFPREELRLGYVKRAADLLLALTAPERPTEPGEASALSRHLFSLHGKTSNTYGSDVLWDAAVALRLVGRALHRVLPIKSPEPGVATCNATCDSERFGCFKQNYGFSPHPRLCKKEFLL